MSKNLQAKMIDFSRYVVGGEFLGIFTEFYAIDGKFPVEDFTPASPEWVGAWWLGFILIVILGLISSLTISIFPSKLQRKEEENEPSIESQGGKEEDLEDLMHVDKCVDSNIKDLPRSIKELISNHVYLFVSIGSAMDAFLLSGRQTKCHLMRRYLRT